MPYDLGDTLVRCVMSNVSGLAEDECVNDFTFDFGAVPPTLLQMLQCQQNLTDFYNFIGTSGTNIAKSIGTQINRAATHRTDFYTIGVSLGSPILSEPWLGPSAAEPSATNLPNECSAVLSFHADLAGVQEEAGLTRPRARRRGRVYIPCINSNATSVGSNQPRLNANFMLAMQQAAVKLKDASVANGGPWSVWSRADQTTRDVHAGWTDNAIDTQRRRGLAASVRTVWGP